tara:strand:- start:1338 stop:1943 length:606 start_codon:yes stop_codon:yes gene_type:complete
MGFFSFKTCDDDESIPSSYVGTHKNKLKKVYLLQPDGEKPVEEANYEGYGVFGGVDVYEWLARQNISDIPEDADIEEVRLMGIYLDSLELFAKGNVVAFMKKPDFFVDLIKRKFTEKYNDQAYTFVLVDDYSSPIVELDGLNLNELDNASRKQNADVKLIDIKEFIHITRPIKLSFDKNANYAMHRESQSCEYQGYFYPED